MILMWLFMVFPFRGEIIERMLYMAFATKSRLGKAGVGDSGSVEGSEVSIAYIGMLDE